MKKNITIGTRGSDLALWQANYIKAELEKLGADVALKIITTKGDKIQNIGFDKLEGKGFFTKEIEDALLNKEVDLAVHSHKDLETNQPEGLAISVVTERENPEDVLLIRPESVDAVLSLSLKGKAIVGTSSARRKSQLLLFRNDIQLKDLRGNVPTRIQKLRDGGYDAIVLAKAGINRLEIDLSEFHVEPLPRKEFIPAPAQGALGLQIRAEDTALHDFIQPLNHLETQQNIGVERKVLNLLQGGCQLPLGVYCEQNNGVFKAWASMAKTWDASCKRLSLTGTDAEQLAHEITTRLKTESVKKSVYISRDLPESTFFKSILENNGFEVHAAPLTAFEQVDFDTVPQTKWVFFSSKNCVRFFLNQQPKLHPFTKFGCVGAATAKELAKFGKKAHFVGEGTDTTSIGKEFAALVGDESVLFPQSSSSFRTIQKAFSNQEQLEELVAYHSIERKNIAIPKTDIAVLTSPTNTHLYFKHNKEVENTTFVAMGNSTASTIESYNKACILPWNSSVIALADAVMSAL